MRGCRRAVIFENLQANNLRQVRKEEAMRPKHFKRYLSTLALAATLCHPPMYSQSIQGSILGSVKDNSGAAVPNATVVITDTDTGVSKTVTTSSSGDYQLLNISADHYKVEVSAPGFESKVLSHLMLTARQQLRADVQLSLGNVDQQVSVDASNSGVISTETPTIDATLSDVEVRDLPANYRASSTGTSPLGMIQAMPGVQVDSSGNFSIQGGLPFQAEVSVDGVTVQSATGNSPMGNAFPSGESISEMRVDGVLNNAEFGQPGEVTTITKGGTNHLHGAFFWYHQNSAFNATPFGDTSKPKLITNDYGLSAGGPVKIPHLYDGRDKTFFFATYEGFRSPQTSPYYYNVPTAAMKQGDFSGVEGVAPLNNPYTGGTYANYQVPINTIAQKFLQFFPDPNVGNTNVYVPGAQFNYVTNKDKSRYSNQFDIRGDQYLGSKALLFGRYTWKNMNVGAPQALLVENSLTQTQDRVFLGAFNYNFTSNLINEFRVGGTFETTGNTNAFDGKSFTEASGLQGLQNLFFNGLPELDFNYMSSLNPDRLNSTTKSRTYVFTDGLSWTKGHHTMKFGFDIRSIEAITPLGFQGADNYGTFDYSTARFTGQEFADFLIGAPSNTAYDVVQSDNDGMTKHYHLYAQDQWKVSNRLTLIYGLRWELHPAYHDPTGNIGNFDPSIAKSGRVVYPDGKGSLVSADYVASFNGCGIGQTTGVAAQNGAPCTPVVSNSQAGLPSGLRSYSKKRFMPRFGFAYRPFSSDRTVVRGGFGFYNITLLGSNFYSLTGTLQSNTQTYGNVQTSTGPLYTWPQIYAGAGVSGSAVSSYGQAYFGTANDVNWKDPYSEQAALSVDHDLGQGYGVRVSYIGMTTHHLVWAPNLNDLPYSNTVSAANQPLTARPFPNWGRINTRSTGASSNYQSLQINVSHRMSRGFSFDSTYTLAKNLSNNQGPASTSFSGESGGARASYAGDPNVDFGQVYGTRRHRWNTTMVYQLPFGRGRTFGNQMNPVLDAVVGGWQLSNIFLLQSGPMLSAYFPSGQGDPSGTGSGLSSANNGAALGGRTQKVDRVGSISPVGGRTRSNWINKASFVCPGDPNWTTGTACHTGRGNAGDPLPIGRFGNSQNGNITGPGTVNLSTGLSKTFPIHGSMSLRAEGTFTNIINHTNLADPNMNISSPQFGVISAARTSDFSANRTGQVSVRLQF